MMSVGARLRALREDAGQSVDDVARGTRLHGALIRGLEYGRPARPEQVRALARHFGMAAEDLAGAQSTQP